VMECMTPFRLYAVLYTSIYVASFSSVYPSTHGHGTRGVRAAAQPSVDHVGSVPTAAPGCAGFVFVTCMVTRRCDSVTSMLLFSF